MHLQNMMLKMQFNRHIKEKAQKDGLTISMRSKGLLEHLVSHTIERMAAANVHTQPAKVSMAEDNLSKFIDAMEKHSKSIGTYPEIGVGAFDRAKRELSPLWPIC